MRTVRLKGCIFQGKRGSVYFKQMIRDRIDVMTKAGIMPCIPHSRNEGRVTTKRVTAFHKVAIDKLFSWRMALSTAVSVATRTKEGTMGDRAMNETV